MKLRNRFLATCVCIIQLTPFTLIAAPGDDEFIPNKVVIARGGKRTPMVTGLFYKIVNEGNFLDDWGGGIDKSVHEVDRGIVHLCSSDSQPGDPFYRRQLWVLVEAPRAGRECYKIMNEGNFLDNWWTRDAPILHADRPAPQDKGRVHLCSYDNQPQENSYENQLWELVPSTQEGAYKIANQLSHYLDNWEGKDTGGPDENRCEKGRVHTCSWDWANHPNRQWATTNAPRQIFQFRPAFQHPKTHYELRAVIENFQFPRRPEDLLSENKRPVTVIFRRVFDNPSDQAVHDTLSGTEQVDNYVECEFADSNSLRFSNSFKVSATAGFNVFGIGASATAENVVGCEWAHDSRESKRLSMRSTKSFTWQQVVTIAPHTRTEASYVMTRVHNLRIPFRAEVKIVGFAERARRDGSAVVAPVDLEALEVFLRLENYRGQIIRREENAVYCEVTGTVTADVGVDTVFSARNL